MARHSDNTVTKALTILAFSGDVKQTRDALKSEGIDVSDQALRDWRDVSHADEYNKIRDKYATEIEQEAIRTYRERMAQAAKAEMLAIQKTIEGLENGSLRGRDASQAALAMSKVKGENASKLLAFTGRPTQIIDDRTAEEAVRALMAKRILKKVNHN